MNIAVVFAGGVGSRMQSKGVPKQFLKVFDKPILIHTLERFQENANIDAIVLAGLPDYAEYTQKQADRYGITKLKKIVPGGVNGQGSIYNALQAAKEVAGDREDVIVLIHDGVRPLIDDELIDLNIQTVKEKATPLPAWNVKKRFLW